MKRILFLAYIFSVTILGQDKKICITVDDLPAVAYRVPNLNKEITLKLIKTFQKYNIPAIGYVNEKKLYKKGQLDSSQVKNLSMWLENGYDLGNHTYGHLDYNKVADSTYFADILKGEKVLRPLMLQYDKELTYFRHPFLHAGQDSLSYTKLNNFLETNKYTTAPITIDTSDYLFAKAYHNAFMKGNKVLMREVGNEYIKYMEQKLLYLRRNLWKYSIKISLIVY